MTTPDHLLKIITPELLETPIEFPEEFPFPDQEGGRYYVRVLERPERMKVKNAIQFWTTGTRHAGMMLRALNLLMQRIAAVAMERHREHHGETNGRAAEGHSRPDSSSDPA